MRKHPTLILSFGSYPTAQDIQTLRQERVEYNAQLEMLRREARERRKRRIPLSWNCMIKSDEEGIIVKAAEGEIVSKATYLELAEKMIFEGKFAKAIYRLNARQGRGDV